VAVYSVPNRLDPNNEKQSLHQSDLKESILGVNRNSTPPALVEGMSQRDKNNLVAHSLLS
jgi:hypothetical protein